MIDVVAGDADRLAPITGDQPEASTDGAPPPGWYDSRVRDLLAARRIKAPQPIRPDLSDVLLRSAYRERIESKRYLWIGLIATAMSPRSAHFIKPAHIDTLRMLSATETAVMTDGMGLSSRPGESTTRMAIVARIKMPIAEVDAAVDWLVESGCLGVSRSDERLRITSYGRRMLLVCLGAQR